MQKWFVRGTVMLVICVFAVLLMIQLNIRPELPRRAGEDDNAAGSNAEWLQPSDSNNIRSSVRVQNGRFMFYENGIWVSRFLFGMNLGAAKPGIYPGDLSISYDDYMRWFEYMGEIQVNNVRVYTAQRPQFYTALYDYNQKADQPIYLFHGLWVNEEDIKAYSDAFSQGERILTSLVDDGKGIVDIIHGNAILPQRRGYAAGTYTTDISQYVAGWILGIEWDPYFVIGTNENNPHRSEYRGNYFYTVNASPFEAFLCQLTDIIVTYQTATYGTQFTVALSNWVTTDPLIHTNNPHPDEDIVTVDVEHIKWYSNFIPGMFASYHVYPYYPDYLNYQLDYINYRDPAGNINPYRAYLQDLKLAHSMPIVISEFGIPSSRARAHESAMGYHQGGVSEDQQGEMIMGMIDSIYQEDYAGCILFSWQDEWFKYTWNTQIADIEDRRPYWSNVQTNEQSFGILAFDPGEEASVCYVDDDHSEWSDEDLVLASGQQKLYIKYDERYLYLLVDIGDLDFEKDTLYIPINTLPDQGNNAYQEKQVKFPFDAEFVLELNGPDNTRLLVDIYYDVFHFMYAEQLGMLPVQPRARDKNTGMFSPIYICLNYPMIIPDYPKETAEVPIGYDETGKLVYGIKNPTHPERNSLADFYAHDQKVEIAIPWMLLNMMDPSGKKAVADVHQANRISAEDVDVFSFGISLPGEEEARPEIGRFTWPAWEMPTYHERLKPAYEMLRTGMEKYLQ